MVMDAWPSAVTAPRGTTDSGPRLSKRYEGTMTKKLQTRLTITGMT